MDEREQIRRARRGDAGAWEALVRQHEEAVFRLAYLLCGDADDAADIAQEVFLRAERGLGGFDSARTLRPWLLGIARNTAHNHRRAARRYAAAIRRWARSAQGAERSDSAEARGDAQQRAARLWQAVQRLRRQDQEIIYLRHFLELPVAETARALGIAPGTAKSRLSRALGRLRALIEAEYPDLVER